MREKTYSFRVKETFSRLDVLLVNYFEDLEDAFSRNSIQKLIKEGRVLVNKKKVKPSLSLKGSETIDIFLPEKKQIKLEKENIPIRTVYEDDYIIVINKKAGMVVHPAPGNYSNTLLNAVVYHCDGNISSIGGDKRPGIVHRIDKDTSGLIVIAKDDCAHLDLVRQFSEKKARRKYLAVSYGLPKDLEGKIETNFSRSLKDRKKFTSKTDKGKKAITYYKVLKSNKEVSLIELSLGTGRTHQIRVHLKDLNFPIVGDATYGRKKELFSINRQALHAFSLKLFHPIFKINMTFFVPLEKDIKKLLKENKLLDII
jgi:23S rRNA pseudouridine1911/1915/1917 synthase